VLLLLLSSLGLLFGCSSGDQPSGNTARPSAAERQTEERPEVARKVTNSLGMTLALVPAGEFRMGAPEDDDLAEKAEKPQHRVRIRRAYYVGVHEVTLGQFRAFVKATGFKTAAETDGGGTSGYDAASRGFVYNSSKYSWHDPGYPQDDSHPVVNVNWHDARAFCDWLSKKEGRTYRLPTEAEWEYACRAGTTTRFYTGDAVEGLKAVANLGDQSLARRWDTATVKKSGIDPKIIKFRPWDDGFAFTAPVGSFQANALGLFDMLGNVGEFCGDGYQADYYGQSPEEDPTGPREKTKGHVVRGGTFLNGPVVVRATSRIECPDAYRNYVIGFRVVLETGGK
jgi:formylglycine-generating enzyme required for sulfatase activity